ncbi:MAG: class I SAM-dependent methyltransferase [Candidatus Aminicenantes bacterium]|nr:MAG: class I SAM-dependent methyltransferase [Candidatus Aminicenantes bacterium]
MFLNYKRGLTNLYRNWGLMVYLYAKFRLKIYPLELLHTYMPNEGTIIDLGSGYGIYTNYLALKSKTRQVLGIDSNPRRISIAKKIIKNRLNIDFKVQDSKEVKLFPCNGLLMTDFLHHIPISAQNDLLQNVYTILKPDGICVIGDVNTDCKPRWKYWISYLSDIILYPFSDKLYFRSSQEMQTVISNIGFKVKIITLQRCITAGVLYICYKKEN